MLLSAGLPVPRCVFGHGFLTSNGLKMGKSMGNVVDPKVAARCLAGLHASAQAFLHAHLDILRACPSEQGYASCGACACLEAAGT
jgi:isoleucyl-tRNA synthetase